MPSFSPTTPPAFQSMNNDDVRHAENMAKYAEDMRGYKNDPCRRASFCIGVSMVTSGFLGSIVTAPVLGSVLATSKFAVITALGASVCTAVCSAFPFAIANKPSRPTHPAHQTPYSNTND